MSRKLILSRKGFDSGTGGGPSPIIDGKLVSLPIPQAGTNIFYKDLQVNQEKNYLDLMRDLGYSFFSEAHLDPDIDPNCKDKRPINWRASFGQSGAALSHLESFGIGPGDIFLFFGWFKEAAFYKGRIRFIPACPDLHCIFGYLEVGERLFPSQHKIPDFLHSHPHVHLKELFEPKGNAIYLSSEHSSLFPRHKGAGQFKFDPALVLTNLRQIPAVKRSQWALPKAFFKKNANCRLSYHHHKQGKTLQVQRDKLGLSSANRGQEFVIPLNKGLEQWIQSMGELII